MKPSPAPESIRTWLRREAIREARLGAILLFAALVVVFALNAAWPAFDGHWRRVNERLARTALHQHPLALIQTFSDRLHGSEYGWRLLAWSAPFNVTVARDGLRAEYPEVVAVIDGRPVIPRAATLKRMDAARFHERETAFLTRYLQIETYRFTWLYGEEDTFGVPDPSAALGQLSTKVLGLPDALLHSLGGIVAAGPVSILLFSTVLALAGLALWQAPRPSRRWLKLLLWPLLASALIWVVVLPMAITAAILGRLTPNTPALVLVAMLPLQWLAARAALRAAAHVFRRVPPGASPTAAIQALTPPALAVPVFAPAPPPPAATADFPAPPPTPPPLRAGQTRRP